MKDTSVGDKRKARQPQHYMFLNHGGMNGSSLMTSGGKTLPDCVEMTNKYVEDFPNYLKVYREVKEKGMFAGAFRLRQKAPLNQFQANGLLGGMVVVVIMGPEVYAATRRAKGYL